MQEIIHIKIYHSPIGNLLLGATSSHLILCDWPDKNGNPRPEVVKRLQSHGIAVSSGNAEHDQLPKSAKHDSLELRAELETAGSSSSPILHQAILQLNEYFRGTRQTFTLPIKTYGTPFQQQVWQQLQTIPYGTTITYKQQAAVLGRPHAVRAVANANRLNALSIIIPCHRVLGSNHSLTGYAGGLDRKLWLLNHEKSHG